MIEINWNEWEEIDKLEKGMEYLEVVVHGIDGKVRRRLFKKKPFVKGITKEISELLKWTPEGVDLKAIGKINYPEKDFPKKKYGEIVTDEDCLQPFISESYLYPLLGKEDARTLLALLHRAFKSLGVDIDDGN